MSQRRDPSVRSRAARRDPASCFLESSRVPRDCALGDGVYRSGYDPRIRAAFASARSFVTPYDAYGLDEYFAECVRAYADVFNDTRSPWPPATREGLRACDAAMYAIVADIFASPS